MGIGLGGSRRLAPAVLLAVVALAAATYPSVAAPGPVTLTTLSHDVLHGLAGLTGRPIDPNRVLYLGVGLRRADPAAEDAYLRDVYDPASPSFHHFLDSRAFEARFGAGPARYEALTTWLRSGGLLVSGIEGTTDYLLASGSARQVQDLFKVQINEYDHDGRHFYANTSGPSVPASLTVQGVAGLQDLVHPQLLPSSPDHPAAVQTGSTSPQDLWDLYDLPGDNMGQGQSLAIFGWGVTRALPAYVTKFVKDHKLPRPITLDIHHYGQGAITDNSGAGEWTLDTTATGGMAPKIDFERLYFGVGGADPDMIAAYNAWVADPTGPLQGSSSFGGCEEAPGTDQFGGGPGNPPGTFIPGNPNQDLYEVALKKAVGLGRTMFASTGDIGGNGCPAVNLVLNGVTLVPTQVNNYPAVSPYAVAVGGTVLYWNSGPPSTRFLEYSWTHTGGGPSFFVAAPDYQSLIPTPGLIAKCVVDPHGNAYNPPAPTCRGIPDVAAQSGDLAGNGYVSGGGTSLSAPLWNGMWTRVQAASKPGGTGFANPAIYRNNSDATRYARDFLDIGGVSTQTIPTCNGPDGPYHCSHVGWDYLSGWGVPDIKNLMLDIDGKTDPNRPAVAAAPSPTPAPSPSPPLPNTSGGQTGRGSGPLPAILAAACALALLAQARRRPSRA